MEKQIKLSEKLAFSISEACAISGLKKDSFYREINAGRLKSAKVRGRRLILRKALEQWLTEQEAATDEAMGFKEAFK